MVGGRVDQCEGNEEGLNCNVYEYYCDGDERKYEIIPCPYGCVDGACFVLVKT